MLEQSLRDLYEVDSSTECRVWHRYMTHTYELLSKPDQTLQDAGLYNGQVGSDWRVIEEAIVVFTPNISLTFVLSPLYYR